MSRRKSSNKNTSGPLGGAGKKCVTPIPVSPPLPSEDASLWAEVTKSLTPLKNTYDRLHFGPLLDEKPTMPRPRNSAASASAHQNNREGECTDKAVFMQAMNSEQTAIPANAIPDLGQFSRREMRQISTGRQSIEARLDLHGLRQAAAHVALRGFLVRNQARGVRHVLVITGKGRQGGGTQDNVLFEEREYGVLRRVVPLWLGEPDLRPIVAGFSEAPRRHGGEGALYVRLRRIR